jgi:hypothetical protein
MSLFCDYSFVGRSLEFPIIVTSVEREQLSVGSFVCVTGDGVPDRQGEVIRMVSNSVFVRLTEF